MLREEVLNEIRLRIGEIIDTSTADRPMNRGDLVDVIRQLKLFA
jgi:hypothetical protein